MSIDFTKSIEEQSCDQYLVDAQDESEIRQNNQADFHNVALVTVEGFEERSVGVLEEFAQLGRKFKDVVIARYVGDNDANSRYRERFEAAAETTSRKRYSSVCITSGSEWVTGLLRSINADHIVLDITGVSNRALFPVLDVLSTSGRKVSLAYCEAGEYRPTFAEWSMLERDVSSNKNLGDIIDEQPWLFASQHRSELVKGHEGYDSAGTSRAMIAFLPYKPARLASVISQEEYSTFLFIAGRPRLMHNSWRVKALKRINAEIIGLCPVIEVDTFGYKNTLSQLKTILFSEPGFLNNYNVHVAIMGSKLQAVACWQLSCLVPSITILTSNPSHYYSHAFSSGIGSSWIFPLLSPFDDGLPT